MKQITVIFIYDNKSYQIEYLKGDNRNDNDKIIDYSKNSGNKDIWFHLKNNPSSHIIALIPVSISNIFLNDIIAKGCLLYFEQNKEKYKNTKSLNINYTNIKNVQKTKTKGLVNFSNNKDVISKKITRDIEILTFSNETVINKYKLI